MELTGIARHGATMTTEGAPGNVRSNDGLGPNVENEMMTKAEVKAMLDDNQDAKVMRLTAELARMRAAMAAERERCAGLCETYAASLSDLRTPDEMRHVALRLAIMIRAD